MALSLTQLYDKGCQRLMRAERFNTRQRPNIISPSTFPSSADNLHHTRAVHQDNVCMSEQWADCETRWILLSATLSLRELTVQIQAVAFLRGVQYNLYL